MTDYIWHDDNYDKRIQLTIDSSKVDEDLIDFPVLIHLSNDSGITHADVTSVFEELTISGSRTKIAVYTVSGTEDVQCYTEIDKWIVTASGVGESWLWVKVPTVSSGVDTHLYLYYDKDAPDNTSYVGDTNSFTASQVWTNDFELVYHMSNASDTTVYDSTNNSYDGTKTASNLPVEVEGMIGNAQSYLDAGEGRIQTVNNTFKETNDFTVEALINPDTISTYRGIVYRGKGSSGQHDFMCTITTGGYIQWWSTNWAQATNPVVVTGAWQQISWVKSSNIIEYFYNGYKDSQDTVATPNYRTDYPTNVGWWSSSYDYDGDIGEVRLSSCVRSPAWLETTYYSNFDNLITFGSEEPKPSFIFNGYVKVNYSPAERTVYLYHRSTGALVGSAVSDPSTGYFEIPTPFNDYHFVNILPELVEDYNIIVHDKIEQGS